MVACQRLARGQALYDAGGSKYVYCVNIDAVIAALLLALLWNDYRGGSLSEQDLERAAFTVFLYGRMIGSAAEIDDHLNRGRNIHGRRRRHAGSWCDEPVWTQAQPRFGGEGGISVT